MRFQPKTLLAAALLVVWLHPPLLPNNCTRRDGLTGLLPARSRARVLAFSCSPADITWFAVGASETPRNSLANSRNYWRA